MAEVREQDLTVKELIEELQKYPSDAVVYAYEGESIAIIITDRNSGKQLGEILTTFS